MTKLGTAPPRARSRHAVPYWHHASLALRPLPARHFVRPRRRVTHNGLDVLLQYITRPCQLSRVVADTREVIVTAGIALGDGGAWVAGCLAFGGGAGEGVGGAFVVEDLLGGAGAGVARIPAAVGGE